MNFLTGFKNKPMVSILQSLHQYEIDASCYNTYKTEKESTAIEKTSNHKSNHKKQYPIKTFHLTSTSSSSSTTIFFDSLGGQKKTKDTDQLFWCFYIILNGLDAYLTIDKKHYTIEMQMKYDLIDRMRKNPLLMDNSIYHISDIEMSLSNSKKMSIRCLYAFCMYYQVNLLMQMETSYYTFLGSLTTPNEIHVLNYQKESFFIEMNMPINEKRAESYYIANPTKPIKAISSYKIGELKEIGALMNINLYENQNPTKIKKKQLLYNEIRDILNTTVYTII